MRVQRITQTSIITRKNTRGDLVNFSGNTVNKSKNSMPSFGVKAPKSAVEKERTIFEEIGDLVNSAVKSVKKSYKKSEIKKVLVDPLTRKWDKFASKSPKLAQAAKGAALLTTGVVLYEAAANKLNRNDN